MLIPFSFISLSNASNPDTMSCSMLPLLLQTIAQNKLKDQAWCSWVITKAGTEWEKTHEGEAWKGWVQGPEMQMPWPVTRGGVDLGRLSGSNLQMTPQFMLSRTVTWVQEFKTRLKKIRVAKGRGGWKERRKGALKGVSGHTGLSRHKWVLCEFRIQGSDDS